MNATHDEPEDRQEHDERAENDPAPADEGLTEYDKTLADSFPSSDPPAQP